MTPKELKDWIATAPGGDTVVYYVGHLAVDREHIVDDGVKIEHIYHQPAHDLGKLAMAGYEDGRLELFQMRRESGAFSYIAFKRRHTRKVRDYV